MPFAWEDEDGRSMDVGDIDTRDSNEDRCPECQDGRLEDRGRSREEDGFYVHFGCDSCEYEDCNLVERRWSRL